MVVSEQHRQVQIAVEVDEAARTHAHSTRDEPNPIDSYRLLAELGPTVDHLQQIVRQLSSWHRRVTDGREYLLKDENGDGVTGTLEAAEQLEAAAAAGAAVVTDRGRAAWSAVSLSRALPSAPWR